MKKKLNLNILVTISVLIMIALMSFLGGGRQIAGYAGEIGDGCTTDEDCDSDFCNENYLCAEPESEEENSPPVGENIASVTIY